MSDELKDFAASPAIQLSPVGAYHLGYSAGITPGLFYFDNPYARGSNLRTRWAEGYNAGLAARRADNKMVLWEDIPDADNGEYEF